MAQELMWGIDYRRTKKVSHPYGERWLTVLTRLNDGRILASWESDTRPQYHEVRQVLSIGLVRHECPDCLWCDGYLAEWCTPLAEKFEIRLHVRMSGMRRGEMLKKQEDTERDSRPEWTPLPEEVQPSLVMEPKCIGGGNPVEANSWLGKAMDWLKEGLQ